MEAFRVWTALEIKGNALKQMERFAALTSVANKHVKELGIGINSLNQRFLILDNRLSRLAPHSEQLLGFFKGLNTSANMNNRSFERYNSQLNRSNVSTGLLAEKTAVLAERTMLLDERIKKVSIDANLASGAMLRMGTASRVSTGGAGGTGTGARRGGSHLPYHGMSHIVGATGASVISGAGAGGALFGGAIIGGMVMHSAFNKSMEYGKMVGQLQSIGFTPDQVKDAQGFTSQTKAGISPLRQMQSLIDAQMATRKFSNAKLLSPSIEKMQFISEAMFNGLNDNQLKSAVKIAEIRGGANPQRIKDELSTVMQMYTTSAGTISPTDFLAFFRRYSGAKRISREGLLALEPTLQEIKPTTVAVGLQTLRQRLHGGVKLSERDSDFYNKIGLMKNGVFPKKYSDILDADPEAFFEKVWLPLLAKKGITTPAAIDKANIRLGRTPSQLFSTLGQNTEKAALAREQGSKLLGLDDLMKVAFKTQGGAALRFMQALESLVIALGKFSSPMTIGTLNAMSSIMERMAKVFGSSNQRADLDAAVGVKSNPVNWGQWFHNFTKEPVSVSGVQRPIHVHTVLKLNEREIGKAVSKHQANELTRGGTQSAPNGVNPMMTPQPTGINNFGGFN